MSQKVKKENDITNSNNKSDSNSNIKPKNKNEIQNLKRYSLFNKKKNILVKSRNSLFLENFTEPRYITEFEENSKSINILNNNIITNSEKYEKEPILITQKINNIKYLNEYIYNKFNKKNDLFVEYYL